MDSDLVKAYNDYKKLAEPVVEYFKKSLSMTELMTETSLEDFTTSYLEGLKGEKITDNIQDNLKLSNVGYRIEYKDPSYKQTRFSAYVIVYRSDIMIVLNGTVPLQIQVRQLIKSECKNGKKFINLVNELKKHRRVKFTIINFTRKTRKANLFDQNVDLSSIADALDESDNFQKSMMINIAPLIFSYGTDDEIKRYWSRICNDHNAIYKILSKDKEMPKAGYPEYRGFLKKLMTLVKITKADIANSKGMSDMGFSDD